MTPTIQELFAQWFYLRMNPKFYNIYNDNRIKGIRASVAGQDDSYFTDGVNKHGIVAMAFYFPEFIQYSDSPLPGHVNIQSLQMVEYILSNASSIDDIVLLSHGL